MFIETVKTPGVASLSYVVGDGDDAAVIDPRRDVRAYLEIARRRGVHIRFVLETHRNEDFVVGSCALAAHTRATILHGKGLDFRYGECIGHGQRVVLGRLSLTALETPGHTDESLSFVARHHETGDSPLAVFSGDALFVGDVGRTDFHPERMAEDAGALYDSIHEHILPLGDHTILHPAHGAGSVCGDGMADRDVSTLGYERRHNPALQLDRAAFVARKLDEHHEKPPYFRKMEQYNLEGPPLGLPRREPAPVHIGHLRRAIDGEGPIIDVREPQAFAASHVPRTVNIPAGMLPAYAGWFLDHGRPVTVIAEDRSQLEAARTHLWRLGYDDLRWFQPGITGWETGGNPLGSTRPISVHALHDTLDRVRVLDVRKQPEWLRGHVPGARHAFLGRLPALLDDLPRDRPIVTFCGSGRRAMIAASLLARAGYEDVRNCFGSLAAWRAIDGPVETPKAD